LLAIGAFPASKEVENEDDDETSEVVRQRFSQTFIHNF
jgi:hypothetical protein